LAVDGYSIKQLRIHLQIVDHQSEKECRMSQETISTPRTVVKERPYAWIILLAVYLASLAAPLNQFKVPPVLELINSEFGMQLSGGGRFMSVFSIAGCILAIPAAFIIQRLGLKAAGLIAVGSVCVGSFLGVLAETAGMLFFGRMVEGVGMGLIMVMAPAAIALCANSFWKELLCP